MHEAERVIDEAEELDAAFVAWLQRHSAAALRLALGTVFLWFGGLKLFPGQSPAEDLAVRTLGRVGLERLSARRRLRLLATLECAIALGLLSGRWMRLTLGLLAFQMTGAMLPLLLFRRELFQRPWAPTLEGQYVIKNVVLIAGGLALGAGVRSRRLDARTAPRGGATG